MSYPVRIMVPLLPPGLNAEELRQWYELLQQLLDVIWNGRHFDLLKEFYEKWGQGKDDLWPGQNS